MSKPKTKFPKDRATIAKAKLLHGQGKASREIAKVLGRDVKTIQKWINVFISEGFSKGFLGAKLDQAEESAAISERTRLGLTKAAVEAKVLDLMGATQNVYSQGKKIGSDPALSIQLGATNLAADVLHMKRSPEQEVLEAGIFAYYREALAKKRVKR